MIRLVALHSCPSGRELLRSRRLPGTLQTALPATAKSSSFSHLSLDVITETHNRTETPGPVLRSVGFVHVPLALPSSPSPSPLPIPSLDPHRPLEHALRYLVRIFQLIRCCGSKKAESHRITVPVHGSLRVGKQLSLVSRPRIYY